MCIHSVFYISLLKSADSETSLQTEVLKIDSENQNAEFKVKEVLRKWVRKEQSQYLVKWVEYNSNKNT